MEQRPKFYISKDKNNIIKVIKGDYIPDDFSELKADMQEGTGEKHIPVVTIQNNIVNVNIGSIPHPMIDEHSIEWVCIKTEKCEQYAYLEKNIPPEIKFSILPDDKVQCIYAYCNQHGLWAVCL